MHHSLFVKRDHDFTQKSAIAQEILAYLAEHPSAQDTLEGIVHWWLMERKIKYNHMLVAEALDELIERGLILEKKTQGSKQASVRLNSARRAEITAFLKKRQVDPKKGISGEVVP